MPVKANRKQSNKDKTYPTAIVFGSEYSGTRERSKGETEVQSEKKQKKKQKTNIKLTDLNHRFAVNVVKHISTLYIYVLMLEFFLSV